MNYYEKIKSELVSNEVYKKVKDYSKNKNELKTYYNVGKLLSNAGKHYGEGIIKQYSIKLTKELGKGYSQQNLKNMRRFYILQKRQTLSVKLTWSHYVKLLKIENINEINYYIKITENQNLTIRELRSKIKLKEYERLDESTKLKLINKEDSNIEDYIKNPIVIKNSNDYEIIAEKILHNLILENISDFMTELGEGFAFINSEYKIKIGNNYNYIDLLLFNIKFNCYVVIELKITELKKEHIGQIEVYMNYIDKNIKELKHNKTIGIIIVKKDNKYIMEYCSDKRIVSKEYLLV